MKRAAKIALLALAAFWAACLPAMAEEPEFEILFPSENESVIAPGRDFYVIGTAPSELLEGGVCVELFREGEAEPVRALASGDSYSAGFDKSLPALDSQYDNGVLPTDIGMPDLVYDAASPSSEADSAIKLAVTQNNFCALILGGLNDGGLSAQGEALTAGDYYIRVTLASGESAEKRLTLGDTPDKLISRYSPAGHFERASAFAAENGVRMYVDLFPGYWSPDGFMYLDGEPMESGAFLESLPRWRFADGLEYETGRVHLVLYNISPSSASESVELAAVQRTGRVDSDLVCYYYDLGEFSLETSVGTLAGSIKRMEAGDKLQLCRAQVGDGPALDNSLALYEPCADELDTDISDGVTATAGESLSIFGVAAPIQNSETQLISDGKNAYTIGGHISAVSYEFFRDGAAVLSETREVGLLREYTEGKTAKSLYEFRHVFELSGELSAGAYTVTAQALDENGLPVEGGSESFTLTVAPAASPATGEAAAVLVFVLLLSACALAAALRKARQK